MTKRKALGKGLSALIPEANGMDSDGREFFQCPIESIEPNPYQPRKQFSKDELQDLVQSIKEKGIITPILVSKAEKGYRLIAGERRWRAAQMAGLTRIPVVIRETTPIESLELALIENIHRKDLNPIEEALAYKRWLDDTDTTQDLLAKRVGKERSTITNLLRLLKLPDSIQEHLVYGRLTPGHARVLVGLESASEQRQMADLIIKNDLSVRKIEELIKNRGRTSIPKKGNEEEDNYLKSLAADLKKSLGTKVEITRRGKKGNIKIHFFSDDELERLLDLLQ